MKSIKDLLLKHNYLANRDVLVIDADHVGLGIYKILHEEFHDLRTALSHQTIIILELLGGRWLYI